MPISPSLTRKCAVTIQGSKVGGSAALGGFTWLVTAANLPAAALALGGPDAVQADGGDVQFAADTDGATRLPAEIVYVASGAFLAWVRVPSLPAGVDTTLWMFWRGGGAETQPAVAAAYGRNAVWADFVLVSHDGSVDATGTHAITLGAGAAATAGPFGNAGGARGFDGSSQYGEAPAALGASSYPVALQCWLNPANPATRSGLLGIFDAASTANWYGLNTQSGRFNAFERSGGNVLDSYMAQTAPLQADVWQHGTGILAGSSDRRAYLNGGGEALNSVGVSGGFNMTRIGFGRWDDATPSDYFAGSLAELWVRSMVPSPARIAAEYANQADPASFALAGAVETVGGTASVLAPDAGSSAHSAASVGLQSHQTLAVQGAVHTQLAQPPTLSTAATIAADAGRHAQQCGGPLVGIPALPPRLGDRAIRVQLDPRRLAIALT